MRRYGAAAVVMAFDEKGQADTYQRKIEICERAYRILVDEVGFPAEDIIFDPNIFAMATGIEEHDNYAVDFIEATRWIKQERCPAPRSLGGVSNVSFSFRGNDPVREAIHTVFLYHAIQAGMDMGIVNAGMVGVYDDLDIPSCASALRTWCSTAAPTPTERLLEIADARQGRRQGRLGSPGLHARAEAPWNERLSHALVHGITDFMVADTEEAAPADRGAGRRTPAARDRRPADGRHEHRPATCSAQGKMFLPQVVKSARVMKQAVAHLMPYIEEEKKLPLPKRRAWTCPAQGQDRHRHRQG